jgi:hypothetical protein
MLFGDPFKNFIPLLQFLVKNFFALTVKILKSLPVSLNKIEKIKRK